MINLVITLRKECNDKAEAVALAEQVKTKAELVGFEFIKAKTNEIILHEPSQEA